MKDKRLLVFSHKKHGRFNNGFGAKGGFTLLIEGLSHFFKEVYVFVPVSKKIKQGRIYTSPNIKVIPSVASSNKVTKDIKPLLEKK